MTDMAIQPRMQRERGAARFSGISGGGDRTRAFRAAKRHSVLVRTLRLLCPLVALSIAGLYFLPSRITVEVEGGQASVDEVVISEGSLKMVNPRINGVHERHGVYDIRADTATQQVANPDLITLNTVHGELVSKKGEKTTLVAPSGLFDSKQEQLTFDTGLTIGGDAGYSGQLQTATAFFKDNKLVSTDPVALAFRNTTINAEAMTFYSSEKRAIFTGNVRVHLEREPANKRGAAAGARAAAPARQGQNGESRQ
jgi:lipopolysaccharide export system protein LptC